MSLTNPINDVASPTQYGRSDNAPRRSSGGDSVSRAELTRRRNDLEEESSCLPYGGWVWQLPAMGSALLLAEVLMLALIKF